MGSRRLGNGARRVDCVLEPKPLDICRPRDLQEVGEPADFFMNEWVKRLTVLSVCERYGIDGLKEQRTLQLL